MIKIGDRVKILKDIWMDGEDVFPSSYVAYIGEEVIVYEIRENSIAVRHDYIKDNSGFLLFKNSGEYEEITNNGENNARN